MPVPPSLLFVLALSLVGCGKASSSAPPTPSAAASKKAASAREVMVVSPVPHPWPRVVVLHGTLEARERVQLAARIAGPIGRLKGDLGDAFAAGTLLAQIDSAQVLAELAQADAELELARAVLARIESVRNPEAVSKRELDDARARVATSDAKQQVAAQRVRDLRVVAPFAGTIAARYVSPGAFVKVGDALFDFVSSGPLRLALEVPEQYLSDVKLGTRLRIEPRDGGGDGADAEIVRSSPALNPQTRTLRVEANVDVDGSALRPGSFVLSTIALGVVSDAMQLPRTAVYSTLGQSRVAMVDADSKIAMLDVDLVGEAEGFVYVRGVPADARVVSQGGANLAPDSEVRVSAAVVPSPAAAATPVPGAVPSAAPVPGAVPSAAP